MFCWTQELNVQRWKEGETDRCLEGLAVLIATAWTTSDSMSVSTDALANVGAALQSSESLLWLLLGLLHYSELHQ